MIALEGVSGESLVNLFRTLSQRRRHGVVSIVYAQGRYEVLFHDGKIVGAVCSSQPVVSDILFRLKQAGSYRDVQLPDGLEHSPGSEPGQNDAVRKALIFVRQNYPAHSADEFVKAKHAVEIDLLHLLSSVEEASARFNPQGVSVDPLISISLSPGQLLLDLVDLAEERRRLQQLADGSSPDQLWIRRSAEAGRENGSAMELSPAENLVWEKIDGGLTLLRLCRQLLISRHAVCERLFSLVDRGMVLIECRPDLAAAESSAAAVQESKAIRGVNKPAPSAEIDLFRALEGPAETAADEISDLSLLNAADSPVAAEQLMLAAEEAPEDYSTLRAVISAIDRSSEVLRNVSNEVFPELPEEEDDQPLFAALASAAEPEAPVSGGGLFDAQDQDNSSAKPGLPDHDPDFEQKLFGQYLGTAGAGSQEDAAPNAPPEAQSAASAEAGRRPLRFRRISQFEFRDLNFFLLDPENAQLISLGISLIFLISILLFGYPLLDTWADSISNFTLNLH